MEREAPDYETGYREGQSSRDADYGFALDDLLDGPASPEVIAELVKTHRTTVGDQCGGCAGLGSHRRLCPRHPDYHPWLRLAVMAEDIGDTIGGNDPGLANQAYSLASRIQEAMKEHPWQRRDL